MRLSYNLAVFLNGFAVATVERAAMPAIVAVAAWMMWREPLTGRKILVAALIGIATIGGFSIYTVALGRLQARVATILAMAEILIVAVYVYLPADVCRN